MTATRLYHLPKSRSTRVLWALEELGAPYELVVMAPEDRRSDEHRTRHPLGRVPVIEDDAGHLFESAAIVLALADRHDGLNFPLGSRERELVYQWVLFAVTEVERWIADARDGESDPERAAQAAERIASAGTVVDEALRGHEFIVGDRFSAADIILSAALAWAGSFGLLDHHPEVDRWLDALDERPARAIANAPAPATA